MADERPLCFDCRGQRLLGLLHVPDRPARGGVVIVVGGPQYRVGSHRQFVTLARALGAAGFAVLRFDYRGMGDSEGEPVGFEGIEEDIRAAVDALLAAEPSLEQVVLWGLCDAATGILFYAHRDPRIKAVAIANPWVRTEAGHAVAYLKQHYLQRLLDPALWRELARRRPNIAAAFRSLWATFLLTRAGKSGGGDGTGSPESGDLPGRAGAALERFAGPVLLILSGNDLTAREFMDAIEGSRRWSRLLKEPRITQFHLSQANHTFSSRAWRAAVENATRQWLLDISDNAAEAHGSGVGPEGAVSPAAPGRPPSPARGPVPGRRRAGTRKACPRSASG